MGEFRPAQPQLANWGGAFQKGFSSSVDAVQNKRDHALKLKTMAMAEERFGWDRKEQVRAANVRKLASSFDAWEDPLKEMADPWHEAIGDKPAYFNDAYLENRFYSDDNKAKQYEIWQSDNSGNPEARKSVFDAKWKAGADAENAKIEQVIKNGLVLGGYTDEEGNPIRDKQIYSQLAIGSKNVQSWAREYQPGIKLFDWRADMTTMDKLGQSWEDIKRPGTLTGDILGNTYAGPLAVGATLAGPAYLTAKAWQKWGPGGASKDMASKVAEGKTGGELKGPKHAKYVNDMTSKINDAEAEVKRIKDGLKKDGKKYKTTAAGKRSQAAALKKANEAVNAANKNVETYNRRVGAKQRIARTQTAKGFGKWFAPAIGGAIGSVVGGDKGEAVGSGAGGAYLMKDAAKKGGKGLTKFVLTKLGQRVPAAIAASAMDGPLPFGELLSLGIGAWTIWSAIKEYNALK